MYVSRSLVLFYFGKWLNVQPFFIYFTCSVSPYIFVSHAEFCSSVAPSCFMMHWTESADNLIYLESTLPRIFQLQQPICLSATLTVCWVTEGKTRWLVVSWMWRDYCRGVQSAALGLVCGWWNDSVWPLSTIQEYQLYFSVLVTLICLEETKVKCCRQIRRVVKSE